MFFFSLLLLFLSLLLFLLLFTSSCLAFPSRTPAMIFTASGDRRSVAPLPTEADLEAATPTTLRYSSDVNDHRFSNKRFSQLSRFSQLTTPWDTPRQTQDFSEKHREQVLRDQYRNSTATASSTNTERHAESKGRLSPTSRWTPHQLFYVFGLDGIGAMFISGGVNFAIAYGEFYFSHLLVLWVYFYFY